MLRSFRVANHKSIRDEQELLLLPAYDRERAVAPVAGIFGANAAGKSNVLDALLFMRRAVRESYSEWEPGSGVPRTPFKLDRLKQAEPSVYVVDLIVEGVRHVYGLSLDDERVVDEWLYDYRRGRRRVIFERSDRDIALGSTLPEYRGRSERMSELTRPNATLISVAAATNQAEVTPVYDWFRAGITYKGPGGPNLTPRLAEQLEPGHPERELLLRLIRAADVGIVDVRIERPPLDDLPHELGDLESDVDWRSFLTLGRAQLSFFHGKDAVRLSAREQSAGTLALLRLLSSALTVLKRGNLFLIDEIDSSLHPRLVAELINLFQDRATNSRGAQIVFTTHDATLLGRSLGEPALERDQVWLVEKDAAGATNLVPLTDFRPRKEDSVLRRYLGGSYGAVPLVSGQDLQRAVGDIDEADSAP